MDYITLDRCKLFGHTGVLDFEKRDGQYFYVTCKLGIDRIAGATTDKLSDTVDYAGVYSIIKKIVESSSNDLIEKLAEDIAEEVLKFDKTISEISVLIQKPDAPIDGDFDSMSVEINRCRTNKLFHEVALSLGSNMGDRKANLTKAIELLRSNPAISDVKVAPLYETEPVGYDDQADFLNTCVSLKTTLMPYELLSAVNLIEDMLHRVRDIRFGPRSIDLDILLYDKLELKDEELTIPHPRMYERAFVLVPLKALGLYSGPIPEDKAVKLIEDRIV